MVLALSLFTHLSPYLSGSVQNSPTDLYTEPIESPHGSVDDDDALTDMTEEERMLATQTAAAEQQKDSTPLVAPAAAPEADAALRLATPPCAVSENLFAFQVLSLAPSYSSCVASPLTD